jgi:hypothetical protein
MPRTQLPVSKEGWSALSDARKPVARSAEMLTQLLVFMCSPKGQIAIRPRWFETCPITAFDQDLTVDLSIPLTGFADSILER